MRIAGPYFNSLIEINEGEIFCLVIEEQNVFRNVILDIHDQICGEFGKLVLSYDNMPISFHKYVDVIESFAPFDINTKALISKINSSIEKNAVDSEHFLDSSKLVSDIENYISELCFDLPFGVECSKLSISSIIKAAAVHVLDDYENTIEAIVAYMLAILDFDKRKLFVTVNMRSYFTDDDMIMFLKEVKNHQIQVLMIENCVHDNLDGMNTLIIDKDLCEI